MADSAFPALLLFRVVVIGYKIERKLGLALDDR
jgi:hypothetical protein